MHDALDGAPSGRHRRLEPRDETLRGWLPMRRHVRTDAHGVDDPHRGSHRGAAAEQEGVVSDTSPNRAETVAQAFRPGLSRIEGVRPHRCGVKEVGLVVREAHLGQCAKRRLEVRADGLPGGVESVNPEVRRPLVVAEGPEEAFAVAQ